MLRMIGALCVVLCVSCSWTKKNPTKHVASHSVGSTSPPHIDTHQIGLQKSPLQTNLSELRGLRQRISDVVSKPQSYLSLRSHALFFLQATKEGLHGVDQPKISQNLWRSVPRTKLQEGVRGLVRLLQIYPWFGLAALWNKESPVARDLWPFLLHQSTSSDFSRHVAVLFLALVPFHPSWRQQDRAGQNVWRQVLQSLLEERGFWEQGKLLTAYSLQCWEPTWSVRPGLVQSWQKALQSKDHDMLGLALRALRRSKRDGHTSPGSFFTHLRRSLWDDVWLLTTAEHAELRKAAITRLAEEGDSSLVSRWLERMSDQKWWVRESAAHGLRLMSHRAWPVLFKQLEHPDVGKRQQAAYVLSGMQSAVLGQGSQKTLARLLEQETQIPVILGLIQIVGKLSRWDVPLWRAWRMRLNKKNDLVRHVMIQAMLRNVPQFRDLLLQTLEQELRHPDWRWQTQAVSALQQLKAIPLLYRVMMETRRHFRIRTEAIMSMGTMGALADPMISALRELLRADAWRIRYAAAEAFHGLGQSGRAAISELSTALSDKNWGVRSAAAAALAKIGPEAIPSLQPLLEESSARSRVMAVETVGRMKGEAVRRLRLLANVLSRERDAMVRYQIVLAMESMSPQIRHVASVLSKSLQDRDWGVRRQAILLLYRGRHVKPYCSRMARMATNDSSSAVREMAVQALFLCGVRHFSVWQRALSDRHWRVRWRALQTIARWGASAPRLRKDLRQAVQQRGSDPAAYMQAASVWTSLVWGRAGETMLQQALSSNNSNIRIYAALALLLRYPEQGQHLAGLAASNPAPSVASVLTTQFFHASESERRVALVAMRTMLGQMIALFPECFPLKPSKRPKTQVCATFWMLQHAGRLGHSDRTTPVVAENQRHRWSVRWIRVLREMLAMPELESASLTKIFEIVAMLQKYHLLSQDELREHLPHPRAVGWAIWPSCRFSEGNRR